MYCIKITDKLNIPLIIVKKIYLEQKNIKTCIKKIFRCTQYKKII